MADHPPIFEYASKLQHCNRKYHLPRTIEVDLLLETIENKIENNEKLTLKDQEALESAAYSHSTKEKHEILLKVSEMVEKSNLPEKKKNILNIYLNNNA